MPHLMYLLFKHQFCFPLKESTPRPKGQPMLQSSHIPSPKIKISETQLSTSHITQSSMPLRDFQSRCSKHQQRPPVWGKKYTPQIQRSLEKIALGEGWSKAKRNARCHILPFQIQVNFFSFAFANDNIVC